MWAAENLSLQKKLSRDIKKLSHDLGKMHWQSWHSTRKKDFMKEKSPIRRTERADKILETDGDRILGYNCTFRQSGRNLAINLVFLITVNLH